MPYLQQTVEVFCDSVKEGKERIAEILKLKNDATWHRPLRHELKQTEALDLIPPGGILCVYAFT